MSVKALLAALLLVGGLGSFAQAGELRGPSACGMKFEVKGGGLQIIVGEFVLKGKGVITCEDAYGNQTKTPVRIQIGGQSPVALKIAAGYLRVAGVATGLGYTRTMANVAGKYLVLGAQASLGVGAGAQVAARFQRNDAATLNVNLQVEKGLGVSIGFSSMTISLM